MYRSAQSTWSWEQPCLLPSHLGPALEDPFVPLCPAPAQPGSLRWLRCLELALGLPDTPPPLLGKHLCLRALKEEAGCSDPQGPGQACQSLACLIPALVQFMGAQVTLIPETQAGAPATAAAAVTAAFPAPSEVHMSSKRSPSWGPSASVTKPREPSDHRGGNPTPPLCCLAWGLGEGWIDIRDDKVGPTWPLGFCATVTSPPNKIGSSWLIIDA